MSTPEILATIDCLEPDPDISGIGVRAAIYIQACVNIACVVLFSLDNNITPYEHQVLFNASLNLFEIGCALLVCAAVQGAKSGLSLHHALVLLNLNWIIGLSALLYVSIFAYTLANRHHHEFAPGIATIKPATKWLVAVSEAHLCGMGAIGIWVWVKNKTFGGRPECNALTSLRMFGKKFNALDPTLRIASIVAYAIMAVPVANHFILLSLASIIFGLLWTLHEVLKAWRPHEPPLRGLVLFGAIAVILLLDISFIVSTEQMISGGCVKKGEGQWTYGQTLALVALSIPFIDTAKMVWLAIRGVDKEERKKRFLDERDEGNAVGNPPVNLNVFRRP